MSTTSTQPDSREETQPQAPRELLKSTTFLLKRLGWAAKDRSHEAFDATGLNPQHFGVLSLLDEGSCEAQAMIADALGYDRSQLVGLLDELEGQGLLERKRDPGDRRRHLVSMTPAGKETLKRLRAVSKRVDGDLLEPLDEDERETLRTLLLKLAAHHDTRFARAPKPR
jgi:DNA-binding MarR family transcriptional regulator